MANEFVTRTGLIVSGSTYLPSATQVDKGYLLSYDTTTKQVYYMPTSSVTVTVPGSDTQVIYNNGGAFGAASGLVYSGSNVGIGTATPGFKLEVSGSTKVTYLQIQNNGYAGGLPTTPEIYSPASATLGISVGGAERLRIETGSIKVSSGIISLDGVSGYLGNSIRYESSQIRIYQSGDISAAFTGTNVLIGNTAGSGLNERLNVTGNGIVLEATDGGITTLLGTFGGSDSILGTYTNDNLQLRTNNTSRIFVSSSGNVGIGTTSPNVTLEANGIIRSDRAGVASQYVQIDGGNAAGPFITAAGAAKVLTIQNNSTTSSDIYFDQAVASTYQFKQATVTKMILDASGNVGINTTSPNATLDVSGSVLISGSLTVSGSSTFTNIGPAVFTGSITQNASTASFGGLVGIGTTSPAEKLDINGNLNFSAQDGVSISARESLIFNLNSQNTQTGRVFQFRNYTSSLVVVQQAGNVGIGETAPEYKLVVTDTNNYKGILVNGSNAPVIAFDKGVGQTAEWKVGISGNDGSSFSVSTGTANTDQFFISSSGNVGIGTTIPAYKLDVNGQSRIAGQLILSGVGTSEVYTADASGLYLTAGTAAGMYLQSDGTFYFRKASSPYTEYMRIAGTGDVQIGTTAYAGIGGSGYLMVKNVIGLVPDNTASTNNRNWAIQANGQFSGSLDFVTSAASASFPNDAYRVSFTRTGGVVASSFTGSFSGSVSAPGSTTQIVYNSGGALAADSGLVYSGSNVGIGTTNPATALQVNGTARATRLNSTGGVVDFDAQTGNNFIQISSGVVSIANSGNVSMTITSAGNVGIGTTSPSELLDVQKAGTVAVRVYNTSSTADAYFDAKNSTGNAFFGINATGQYLYTSNNIPTLFYNSGSERMRISAAGNVGIGNTSPNFPLHIGDGSSSEQIMIQSNGGGATLRFYDSVNNSGGDRYQMIGHLDTTSKLQFSATSSGEIAMSINSDGRIGMGTTNPSTKLQVDGTITSTGVLTAYTSVPSINIGHDGSAAFIAATSGGGASSPIYFSVGNNDEKMRITSAGNVGIGTNNPSQKLHVSGSALINGTIYSGDGSISTSNSLQLQYSAASGDGVIASKSTGGSTTLALQTSDSGTTATKLYISSAGNVGIGTTSPGSRLQVEGTNPFIRVNNTSTSDSGIKISYNGNDNHGLHLFYNPGSAVSYIDNTYQAVAGQVYGDINLRQNVSGSMTSRMIIKAESGNVGIGVTSPTYNLEVSGSGYISGSLTVAGTITAQKLNVQQVTSSVIYSSGSNIFGNDITNTQTFTGSIQATGSTHYLLGNVGINNTIPAYSLDISGTPTNAILNLAKSDGDQFLRFIGGSGGANQLIQTSYNLGIDVGGAGNRAMTILSGSGNVGIGTTNPTGKLEIFAASDNQLRLDASGTYSAMYLSQNQSVKGAVWMNNGTLGMFVGTTVSSGYLAFGTDNSSEKVRITSAGNVGIGTTSPSSLLNVVAAGNNSSVLVVEDNARKVKIGRDQIQVTDLSDTFSTMYLQPDSNLVINNNAGNVGIGTQPSYKLHVDSNTDSLIKVSNGTETYLQSTYFGYSAGYDVVQIGDVYGKGNNGVSVALGIDPKIITGGAFSGYEIALPDLTEFMTANGPSGSATDWNQAVLVLSGSSVGIGTGAPSTALTVAGAISSSGATYVGGNLSVGTTYNGFAANIAGTTYVIGGSVWVQDGYGYANASSTNTGFYPSASSDIKINSAGATRLFIASGSGNVGIGTSSPDRSLLVSGSIGAFVANDQGAVSITVGEGSGVSGNIISLETNSTTNTTRLYNNGTGTDFNIGSTGTGGNVALSSQQHLYFKVNNGGDVFSGTTAMYVSSSGNVGIGTTSPGYKLDVRGNTFAVGPNGGPGVIAVYEAESLSQTGGSNVSDSSASGGSAWLTSGSYQIFGPYSNLPQGSYRYSARIKVADASYTGNAVRMSTYIPSGSGQDRYIKGTDFAANDTWEMFSIPFRVTGTTSNDVEFYVFGLNSQTISVDYIIITPDTDSYTTQNWGNFYVNGNVGINTTAPEAKLDIYSTFGSNNKLLYVRNGAGSVNTQVYDTAVIQSGDVTTLRMVERNVGDTDQLMTFAIGDGYGRIATTAQPLQFFVNGSTSGLGYQGLSGTLAMTIATTGNVGIGTTDPGTNNILNLGPTDKMLIVGSAVSTSSPNGTRSVTLWSTNNFSPWSSWVGTNLYVSASNFYKPSDGAGDNWGNTSGIFFQGANTTGTIAMRFIADEPGGNGLEYNIGSSIAGALDSRTRMVITNNGNVGIGTTNPQGALHVYSGGSERLKISGDVEVAGSTDFNITGANRRFSFTNGTGTIRTTNATNLYLGTNSTTAITISGSNQYVGIGSNSPAYKLDVSGDVRIQTIDAAASDTDKFLVSDSGVVKYRTGAQAAQDMNVYTQTFTLADTSGTSQWIKLGTWTANQGGRVVTVQISQHQGYNATTAQNQEVFIFMKTSNYSSVDPNGFAGDSTFWTEGLNNTIGAGDVIWEANAAGVSATAYTLYILAGAYTANSQYTVTTKGGTWTDQSATASPSGTSSSSTILLSEQRFNVNNQLYVDSTNVGIGNTNPSAKLDVSGNARVNDVLIGTDQTYGGNYRSVSFGTNSNSYNRIFATTNASDGMYFASATGTGFSFRPNGGTTNSVVINSSGNVGIGTSSPSQRLHVSGAIAIEAESTTTKYSTTFSGSLAANTNIAFVPTGSFKAAFFDYYVASGSVNMRAGTVMSVHNNSTSRYTDTSTGDIGDTSAVDFSTSVVGGDLVLTANISSGTWEIKTSYRAL